MLQTLLFIQFIFSDINSKAHDLDLEFVLKAHLEFKGFETCSWILDELELELDLDVDVTYTWNQVLWACTWIWY